MKPLIIIPTYNEKENIVELIGAIRTHVTQFKPEILVVDSASPDGTAQTVEALAKNDSGVHLFQQPKKLGLGKAYLDGMTWALARDYDRIVTMDADFSHHPRYLDQMLQETLNADVVVGSRYIPGGRLENWPLRRRMLSRFANWFATTLTRISFNDLTAGFHAFRADLLRKILSQPISTEGYAFLVELKYHATRLGAKCKEIPIVFSDRTKGQSKISKNVMFESMVFVLKLAVRRYRSQ